MVVYLCPAIHVKSDTGSSNIGDICIVTCLLQGARSSDLRTTNVRFLAFKNLGTTWDVGWIASCDDHPS